MRKLPLSRPLIAAALMLASLLFSAAARADFAPAGGHDFHNAPGIHEAILVESRGPTAFDRIGLHHVAATAGVKDAPVLLFLPGTNMNGQVANDDPHHDLILYLAAHGVDCWAMDYRTHFVPADAADAQLAELKYWSNELFEGDIDDAVKYVEGVTGRSKIFVGGFSRGVAFTYLYAAMHPERVRGLVIFDGFALKPSLASGLMSAAAKIGGRYADDIGGVHLTYDKRKALMQLVIENPDAPAPIAKYKSARENLEHVVYDSAGFGGHGGLANPQGGFSDPVVLAHLLVLYDRWWPAVQNGEDSMTPELKKNLAGSKIPVLAFSSTNIAAGWPAMVQQSAALTGSPDVTFKSLPGWGHVDVLCGSHAEAEVYEPALKWLKSH